MHQYSTNEHTKARWNHFESKQRPSLRKRTLILIIKEKPNFKDPNCNPDGKSGYKKN
jgi:hypothetical protein